MARTLQGAAVLITEASSGIGRMTAFTMAQAGASLVLVARRADRLQEVTAEIEARGGTAVACPGDVTVPGAIGAAVHACVSRFGRLDALVNNAGEGFFVTMDQTTEEDLSRGDAD